MFQSIKYPPLQEVRGGEQPYLAPAGDSTAHPVVLPLLVVQVDLYPGLVTVSLYKLGDVVTPLQGVNVAS